MVVNPRATGVEPQLVRAVIAALRGPYAVEAVECDGADSAAEAAREAVREGFEVVVPFGGDGAVNAVANGLAGSSVPLSPLPGGATNVFARLLGVPRDPVAATERLLSLAEPFATRRVDLGRVNGRFFVFGSGIGLTASVVARVDANPRRKARLRQWYFAGTALAEFGASYAAGPPRLRARADAEVVDGVTLVVQNADPFTFFGSRPIRVCARAGLDTGTLSAVVLERAAALDLVTLAPRLFLSRPEAVERHAHVRGLRAFERLHVSSAMGAPLPLEVDGDHLGEVAEALYEAAPGALRVLS